MNKTYIKSSKTQGRGVFAKKDIRKGSVIEHSPVIVLNKKEEKVIHKTILSNYHYEWINNNFALALGCGSLFNHSYNPNARYEMSYKNKSIKFISRRDIKKGEEIFINYNGKPDCKNTIWFNS